MLPLILSSLPHFRYFVHPVFCRVVRLVENRRLVTGLRDAEQASLPVKRPQFVHVSVHSHLHTGGYD